MPRTRRTLPLGLALDRGDPTPLAEQILQGDILDGSTVAVTAGSDRLNLEPKTQAEAPAEQAA